MSSTDPKDNVEEVETEEVPTTGTPEEHLNKDSNDFIINMVSEVIQFAKKNPHRITVINHYNTFYENYPALVNMIIDDPYNFDFKRLVEMLSIREKIVQKEVSYDDASLYVGEKYYEEFVKPKLDADK